MLRSILIGIMTVQMVHKVLGGKRKPGAKSLKEQSLPFVLVERPVRLGYEPQRSLSIRIAAAK